jgi:electron transport complex protein RnfG
MKGMLKLGFVLALYATAACVGLAFVYSGTAGIIAGRQQADLEASLRDLFAEADSFEDIRGAISSPDPGVAFEALYAARQGGRIIGVALRASRASYGGPITVLVGVGNDGRIRRIKILEHKDTPGLGANAASPAYYVDKPAKRTFYDQFTGKGLDDPFEVHQDVTAVTASTITSRAVTGVVKTAGDAAYAWLSANPEAAAPGGN